MFVFLGDLLLFFVFWMFFVVISLFCYVLFIFVEHVQVHFCSVFLLNTFGTNKHPISGITLLFNGPMTN